MGSARLCPSRIRTLQRRARQRWPAVGCAGMLRARPGTAHPHILIQFGGSMAQAKQGDTVRVHYTGTLDDGQEFDSSRGLDPLTFTLGTGSVILGFDDAVTGMTVGDEK